MDLSAVLDTINIMIVVFTGLPGAGKSLKLARTGVDVLYRNRGYFEKTGKKRMLYTNLKFSADVEKEFSGFIEYWTDLRKLVAFRDCDVIIDEVAVYFNARQWENMSIEVMRWLAQHRKFGIEIYGTAQDFAQTDKAFRRLTSDLLYLTKLFGSRDISATRPSPKYIWGLSLVRTLDPTRYDEEKSKFANDGLPRFMTISRRDTKIFDTRAEVTSGGFPPLKHIARECELSTCTFHKVAHI